MRLRYIIPLAVFAVLVVLLGIGLTLDPREVPSPLIGKPAPGFSLPQLADANRTVTRNDLLGKVTLLSVWASWCSSCRQEHPLLLQLAHSTDVEIVGLNYKDNREQALRWLAQLGNPYSLTVFDANGRVGIDYGVYGVPETYVIDRQGIIRYKQIGPLTREVIEDRLLPLIHKLKQHSISSESNAVHQSWQRLTALTSPGRK